MRPASAEPVSGADPAPPAAGGCWRPATALRPSTRVLASLGTLAVRHASFNFFLFRVLPGRPGRALHPRPRRRRRSRSRALRSRRSTSRCCSSSSTTSRTRSRADLDSVQVRPAGVGGHRRPGLADAAARRHRHHPGHVIGVLARHPRRLEPRAAVRQGRRPATTLTLYSMPEFWFGMILLIVLLDRRRARCRASSPIGGLSLAGRRPGSPGGLARRRWHLVLPVTRSTLVYLAEYSLVMRASLIEEMGAGLPADGAGQGPARQDGAPPARRAQRAAADAPR